MSTPTPETHHPRLRRRLVQHLVTLWLLTAPAAGQVVDVEKLARQVTIRRDSYGIPHIRAQNEEAAAFGFGYAQAEDHVEEIARRFVRARGQEARHFGPAGLENDLAMARVANLEEARAALRRVGGLYRTILEAYAAGVNRYVEKHRNRLPAWIPVLTAADVLASSRSGAAAAVSSAGLLRRLREKYPADSQQQTRPQETHAEPPESDDDGSNALALAGSRTTSGAPLLLGNPHLSWSSLYWEAQVTVPGKINFYGSTLAGIPVLRAGFNEHLGFVTTNNAPDLEEVYALRLDPARPDHYLFEGRSRPMTRYTVAVEVLQSDGSLKKESREYLRSHLGPVVHQTADRAFAFRSTSLEAFRYFEGFYRLSRSRNLREWQSNLRRNLVPTSNFTYADRDGNILYQWNGRVPKRPDDGTDYRLDVPADDGKYVWRRLHKTDELPRLLNPASGAIQNANNPPRYTSLAEPLDPGRYPSYFESGPLSLRAQLSLELIARRERLSPEDVIGLKYGTRMLLAERVLPELLAALRGRSQKSEEADAALRVLEAWDRGAAAESRGALLFLRFWDAYSDAVRQPFAVPWDEQDPVSTPRGIADPALAVSHLEQALRWMRANYGSEDVAWGQVNRLRAGAVDLPGEGCSGTYGCYRVMRFEGGPAGPRAAGHLPEARVPAGFGDAWILLVHFTQPVQAWSVLAYGQTTQQDSPHSRDQMDIFAGRRLRPVWFTEADIQANLQRSYQP